MPTPAIRLIAVCAGLTMTIGSVWASSLFTVNLDPSPFYEIVDPLPGASHPIRWNLRDVIFEDGATASGYFIWDADAPHGQQLRQYRIRVSGGGEDFPNYLYWNGISHSSSNALSQSLIRHDGETQSSLTRLVFLGEDMVEDRPRQLRLRFTPMLVSSIGTRQFATLDESSPGGECYNCYPWRSVTGGYIEGSEISRLSRLFLQLHEQRLISPLPIAALSPIPEPLSWVTMATGLLLIGLRRKIELIRSVLFGERFDRASKPRDPRANSPEESARLIPIKESAPHPCDRAASAS